MHINEIFCIQPVALPFRFVVISIRLQIKAGLLFV